MIDTIKAYGILERTDALDKIFNQEDNNGSYVYTPDRITRILKFRNIKIAISPFGINQYKVSLIGSLHMAIIGNSYIRYKRLSIKRLLDAINDELGIRVDNLKVTRVDVGVVVKLQHEVSKYLPNLIELGRLKRDAYNFGKETIRFRSNLRELVFYDKNTERIKRGERINIPDSYKDSNALRVELKHYKMRGLLGDRTLEVKDLYSKWFFLEMTNRFIDLIKRVRKERHIELLQPFSGIKDFQTYLACCGIEFKGGTLKVLGLIETFQFLSSKKYTFKRRVRKLSENTFLTKKSSQMQELERKLISKIQKYRPE